MKPYYLLSTIVCLAWLAGCNSPSIRSQSPEEIAEKVAGARLVRELAVPYQLNSIAVEAIGLVSGLNQTGSDPPPSAQRAHLVDEMRTRGVESPNALLATNNYSLVLVRGYLRPGIQKGDRFDIEVRVPSQSETTSLRGGWLMETRLRQLAVLGNEIREGNLLALGQGALLVDPPRQGEPDRVREGRARILGGGISLVSRPVALVMKPDYQSVRYTSQVAAAINLRFHVFTDGIKNGVARPKDNKYIELEVHPRYKDNIDRYVQVVRSLPLKESATERMERLSLLERQLLDPVTAQNAALRLEAIGRDGLKALRKGAQSPDREVRFYAAEALAYLDDASAAEPLARAVREEPAFRVYALAALSAMDDVAAYDQLSELLHSPSAETRYGAFRALWEMNPHDSLVRGEQLGDQFSYHVLDTSGPAMVHATRSRRAELVLFGRHEKLRPPLMFEAGKVMINAAAGSDEITIARFAVGQPDQRRTVSRRLDDVIRAVVELGATYPDVVHLLEQAKASGALECRFAVDALPEAGRSYRRGDQPEAAAEAAPGGELDLEASQELTEEVTAAEPTEASPAAAGDEPASPDDQEAEGAKPAQAGQKRKKAPSLWGAFARMRGQD